MLKTRPDLEPTTTNRRHAGRPCAHPQLLRLMAVLTNLHLHIPQTMAGLRFGIGQEDAWRDVRRLLPLIQPHLPCPEVWTLAPATPDAPPRPLMLALQGTQRVLFDATEQRVERPQDALAQADFYAEKTTTIRSKRTTTMRTMAQVPGG